MSFPRNQYQKITSIKTTRRGILSKLHIDHKSKQRTKSHFVRHREKHLMIDQLNEFSLCSLSGQTTLRGTQKFRNQIFIDAFDKEGHHDKILLDRDSTEIFEDFEEIKERYLLVRRELQTVPLETLPTTSKRIRLFSFSPQSTSLTMPKDFLGVLKPLSVCRHLHLT